MHHGNFDAGRNGQRMDRDHNYRTCCDGPRSERVFHQQRPIFDNYEYENNGMDIYANNVFIGQQGGLNMQEGGFNIQDDSRCYAGFGGGGGGCDSTSYQRPVYVTQQNRNGGGGRFIAGAAVATGLVLLYNGIKKNGGFKGLLDKVLSLIGLNKPVVDPKPAVDPGKAADPVVDPDAKAKADADAKAKADADAKTKADADADAKAKADADAKAKADADAKAKADADAAAVSTKPKDKDTDKDGGG